MLMTPSCIKFKPQEYNCSILKMEAWLEEIRAWMSENLLKLNDSKTEFMVTSNTNPLSKLPDQRYIVIGNEQIRASSTTRNIGAVLDSHLDMVAQVNSVYVTGKLRNQAFREMPKIFSHFLK